MTGANKNDRLFTIVVGGIFALFAFTTLYPFVYSLSYSLSDGISVLTRPVFLLPVDFTFENYRVVFANKKLIDSFLISIARTISGTVIFLLVTGICAYPMSKKNLVARKLFFSFFVIPMYISGGLLPYYVLLSKTGFTNNFLVYIIPGAFGGFFMLIIKAYYEGIPMEIEESGIVDGAGEITIYFRMILPLSKPVFATAALFTSVAQWNAWFDALLFVTNFKLHPLQLVLQFIMKEADVSTMQQVSEMFRKTSAGEVRNTTVATIRMAVLMVTVMPIIFVYPFFQKYFTKGLFLGSVKL